MSPKVTVILPIRITEKWQAIMTDCCIATMRATTEVPYELIVVESGSDYFGERKDIDGRYLHFPQGIGYAKEFNRAIDMASGDYIVHIGNDIFTRPGWLEALLKCFEIPSDCGAATLASSELGHEPIDIVMEGLYCPIMMFKKEWRFDEDFSDVFLDSDLIMRIYKAGFRMYRNWNVVITHLCQQTFSKENTKEQKDKKFNAGKDLFIKKHSDSSFTLWMYRAIIEGWKV